MYISNISGFAKESYGKLPETGTITAALPDQNLAPIIITDVSQFQTSVREEAQRLTQIWPHGMPRYQVTLIFNLEPPDAYGNRSITGPMAR